MDDKLYHFQQDHAEPNQGMHHQIIRRYKLLSDIMQRRVLITNVPSSIDMKSKRNKNTSEVNWHNLLFWGLCPSSNNNNNIKNTFWKLAMFLFSRKETPNLVDLWDWVILNYWASQSNLLWCVHENRPSPRVVTGKWQTKNLKIKYKAQK
jgi:hypothetical protein